MSSASARPRRGEWRGVPREVLLLSGSFFAIWLGAGAFQQFLISSLTDRYGWSTFNTSLLLVVLYVSLCITRLFASYVMWFLGERRALIAGAGTYALFMAVVVTTGSYPLLVVAAVIWGWGAATLWTSSSARVLDVARRTRYGFSSGLFYLGMTSGFTIGVLMQGSIIAAWGARPAMAVALACTALGVGMLLRLPAGTPARTAPSVAPLHLVAASRSTRWVVPALFAAMFSFGLVVSSFADLVKDVHGIGSVRFITVAFWAVQVPVGVFGGALSDRLGRRAVMFWGLLLGGVGLVATIVSQHAGVLFACAAALGIQMAIVPVAALAVLGDAYAPHERPRMVAALYFWGDLGLFLSVLVSEYLWLSLGGFQAPFAIFAAMFFACAVFVALVRGPAHPPACAGPFSPRAAENAASAGGRAAEDL